MFSKAGHLLPRSAALGSLFRSSLMHRPPPALRAEWERKLAPTCSNPDEFIGRDGKVHKRKYPDRKGAGGRAVETTAARRPSLSRAAELERRQRVLATYTFRQPPPKPGHPTLRVSVRTRRRIYRLYAQGLGYRDIGHALGLSYRIIRRVVREIDAAARGQQPVDEDLHSLVARCDRRLVEKIRDRLGGSFDLDTITPADLEALRADPEIADLLVDDRRGPWDLALDFEGTNERGD